MTEVQGTTTVFSENLAPLNDNGSRATATEMQLQIDGSLITSVYTWTYDDDGRLLSEGLSATGNSTASSATAAGEDYSDLYAYDLNGNRMKDTHTGPGNGATAVTVFAYNGDDQLTAQGPDANNDGVPDSATATVYTYDLNGSQTKITTAGTVKATYTYDVLNKMVGFSNSTTTASYVYDDAGNRVQETTGGTTTYFLTDNQNLTGYAQPLEERQTSVTSTPTKTYLIGDRTFGQASNTSSVSYLLIDGHGSTQQITNSTGTITATLSYTASGSALNFNPAAVGCVDLFANDCVYDPVSGLYMNGDGTRDRTGFRFIQADTEGNGNSSDPISLHKYLYGGGNPVNNWDPSGHDSLVETLAVEDIGESVDSEQDVAVNAARRAVTAPVANIYFAFRVQAYKIPIHFWLFAGLPTGQGARYDIGAGTETEPPNVGGLLSGDSQQGFLSISPATFEEAKQGSLVFKKVASLNAPQFFAWELGIQVEARLFESNFADTASLEPFENLVGGNPLTTLTIPTTYSLYAPAVKEATNCFYFSVAAAFEAWSIART